MRKRLLFVSENVTLAQVVRLLVLARSVDPARYEVHFACAGRDPLVFAGTDFHHHELATLNPEHVFRLLEKGKRLYEKKTLLAYVDEELALFRRVQPHLVIGDFRLSLPVSAPLAGIPHAALINAYWSPYAVRDGFPIPDHPIVKLLGLDMATRYFPLAIPKVFAHFAKPINEARRHHGLPPIGSLLDVLCAGGHTLYPDVPYLVPTVDLPTTHRYLGPVLWAPDVALPKGWEEPSQRPKIYVTLGSSGKVDALPKVLEGLAQVDARVLLATAGRATLSALPSNVEAVPYVPGDRAARAAALVICNGGSSTGYQALAEGTPVLGIASNFDQYLAMTAVARVGAGKLLRAGLVQADEVRAAVQEMLGDDSFAVSARRAQEALRTTRCEEVFGDYLTQVLG